MSDNIIKFYPKGSGDNPDAVLEQAVGVYSEVLIIGYDQDNIMDVRSTGLKHHEALWLVEYFKKKLLEGDFNE